MHQFLEKIVIFAKRCGVNILDLLHRIHAVSAPLAERTLVILKLVLKKIDLFAKTSARAALIILLRIYAGL
ncbi:MAG: hypothetical protein V3V89_02660, partial [Gammaproteobacteria bacterium]